MEKPKDCDVECDDCPQRNDCPESLHIDGMWWDDNNEMYHVCDDDLFVE